MSITISDIINKTCVILNEARGEDDISLLSLDLVNIKLYAKGVLNAAIREIYSIAPNFVVAKHVADLSLTDGGNGAASIVIPSSIDRIVAVRLSGWNNAVTTIIDADTADGRAVNNPYNRPTKNNPVCTSDFTVNGMIVKAYPYNTNDTLTTMLCVSPPQIAIEAADSTVVAIDSRLFDPICTMTASLVYDVFEKQASADKMRAIAEKQVSAIR